jgi:hypothetical protein
VTGKYQEWLPGRSGTWRAARVTSNKLLTASCGRAMRWLTPQGPWSGWPVGSSSSRAHGRRALAGWPGSQGGVAQSCPSPQITPAVLQSAHTQNIHMAAHGIAWLGWLQAFRHTKKSSIRTSAAAQLYQALLYSCHLCCPELTSRSP